LLKRGYSTSIIAKRDGPGTSKRIDAKGYADNVVNLMVGKLIRLPSETQKALQQLACLGHSADFALLALVYRDSEDEMHTTWREAVGAGFVLHSEGAYRFLHDRVQEAALLLDPGKLARRGPSPNREAALSMHLAGEARGGDLRNRQSTQPWVSPHRVSRGA